MLRRLVASVFLVQFAVASDNNVPGQLDGAIENRSIFIIPPQREAAPFFYYEEPQESGTQSNVHRQIHRAQTRNKPTKLSESKSQNNPGTNQPGVNKHAHNNIGTKGYPLEHTQNNIGTNKPNRHRFNDSRRKIGFEVDLAIRPYFIGPEYLPKKGLQYEPKGKVEYEPNGPPSESRKTSGQSDDRDPSTYRPKRIPFNFKASIGDVSLNLRIEDVNQIWGYAEEEEHSENPFMATEKSENEQNLYSSTYNGTDSAPNETNHKNVNQSNAQPPTHSTERSDTSTTFDFDQWIKENLPPEHSTPGPVSIPATTLNVKPLDASVISTNHGTDDEDYKHYGLKEFDAFLAQKSNVDKNKLDSTTPLTELGLADFDKWLEKQSDESTKYDNSDVNSHSTHQPGQGNLANQDEHFNKEWIENLFVRPTVEAQILNTSEPDPNHLSFDERISNKKKSRTIVPKSGISEDSGRREMLVFPD